MGSFIPLPSPASTTAPEPASGGGPIVCFAQATAEGMEACRLSSQHQPLPSPRFVSYQTRSW